MADETPEQQAPVGQEPPDPATERAAADWLALTRGALSYDLDDEGVAAVTKGATRLLGVAAKLRAYPLTNADEPGFVFHPYRAEG